MTGADVTDHHPPRPALGFTLLEVLVAFVIAAIALSVMAKAASGGLLAVHVAGSYQEALSRAQSRLDAVGRGAALAPGDAAGDDGKGFAWRTRVTQIARSSPPNAAGQAAPPDNTTPQLALYAVEVVESWSTLGRRRSLALKSERLGAVASDNPP